jgi:hypothetical protein
MRRIAFRALVLAIVLAVPATATRSSAQSGAESNACLAIHDATGPLANGGTLCQNAVGKSCTFDLSLCVNEPDGTCVPENLTKTVHAMGHCGPVRKLQVAPSGESLACSPQPTSIKVRTRGNHKGQCTIQATVRSAKTHAHTAKRTVTLVCQPSTVTCPSTTTTTSTVSTTSTTTTTL